MKILLSLFGLLLVLTPASLASANYIRTMEVEGTYYPDLDITIVGPPQMRELVLDGLETMPWPWREYVLKYIRSYRQIQGVDWALGTWQNGVKVRWESDYTYTKGQHLWLLQAALVHEAKHVDDWNRCVVLGGPESEARGVYIQAEFFFNIAWLYYPGWRDYFYSQGQYYAGLAGKHGLDQPWRILKKSCSTAYDPLTLRAVVISPDWVRN